MKHEYHEGPEAAENLTKLAKKMFRAPKTNVKMPVRKPKRPARTSVYVSRVLAVSLRNVDPGQSA